jgi:hypothetical protein
MSIHLGGDTYTLPPAPDTRLRCLVQVTSDLAGKPLSQLLVFYLACLEGHYAIEFAMQGAEAAGIEYRAESVAKARFVRDYLDLDRLTFYQDDVRNLSGTATQKVNPTWPSTNHESRTKTLQDFRSFSSSSDRAGPDGARLGAAPVLAVEHGGRLLGHDLSGRQWHHRQ